MSHKNNYLQSLEKLSSPVLQSGIGRTLRTDLPAKGLDPKRHVHAPLEAVARLLCGMAPALEASLFHRESLGLASKLIQVHATLDSISDPVSPDYLRFDEGTQSLVDAAFLAQAMYRAPNALWRHLPQGVRSNLLASLHRSRQIRPHFNNWLLFSAMIEAFLCSVGEEWDPMRVDYALKQHDQWYVGDGTYSDGPQFHWDYYNSFVIHPMLIDVLESVRSHHSDWSRMYETVLKRAKRHCEVLERMVGPNGSYPPLGRSLAYRCGAFHLLAQLSYKKQLPEHLNKGAVRGALWATIAATLGAPETYDAQGWLNIGVTGHQPDIGESYINCGSLYLCSVAFLPLGLPSSDDFWQHPDAAWTQRRLFSQGIDIGADKAL